MGTTIKRVIDTLVKWVVIAAKWWLERPIVNTRDPNAVIPENEWFIDIGTWTLSHYKPADKDYKPWAIFVEGTKAHKIYAGVFNTFCIVWVAVFGTYAVWFMLTQLIDILVNG